MVRTTSSLTLSAVRLTAVRLSAVRLIASEALDAGWHLLARSSHDGSQSHQIGRAAQDRAVATDLPFGSKL